MNGFLNVLKPPGMTSSQVVGAVRRLLDGEKAGHAGTLDPQAAGVLPVMAGKAARLFDYLVDKEKTYVAEIAFGAATDTQDAQGQVIATGEMYPSLAQVREILPRFTGDLLQTPPAYSAIQVGGRRLYDLARKGEVVDVPARPVRVEEIALQGEMPGHGMMLRIRCGKGTYVRTLCHDIGTALGCPAHMRFLLRAGSGPFSLNTASTLEELCLAYEQGRLAQLLLPMDMPLAHLQRGDVPENLSLACRNGAALPAESFPGLQSVPQDNPVRLYLDGAFMGVACRRGDRFAFRAMVGQPA